MIPRGLLPTYDAEGNLDPLTVNAPDLIRWIEAKNPQAIDHWRDLGTDEYSRAFTAARTAGLDVIDDLYFAFADTIEKGGTEKDYSALVVPTLRAKGWLGGDVGQIASRVALIYDTNLRMARGAGQWDRIQKAKSALPYLRGVTAHDQRVRHPPKSPHSDHRAWDGIVLPVDHPFWTRYWVPLGFRCFLPGTRIKGAVRGAIRRRHHGKAVELTMRSGARLSVTPDHPILTGRGWVMAQHVRIGENTLRDPFPIGRNATRGVNNEHSPPRADDLFNALATTAFAFADVATLKLDYQFAVDQDKIDVVTLNNKLPLERWTDELCKHVLIGANGTTIEREADASYTRQTGDLRLADAKSIPDGSHSSTGIVASLSEAALKFIVTGSRCAPSAAALALDSTRPLFDRLPLDRFRLGSAAHDDALFAELTCQTTASDSGLFRELLNARAPRVSNDEVVDIRHFDFSGHVYDFQTEEGILAADSIIVHNCRCSIIQMSRSQFARGGYAVTSADELAQRERRLGPPLFTAPGAGVIQQVSQAAQLENDRPDRMPGLPTIDIRQERTQASALWASQVGTVAIDALFGSLGL